MSGVSFVFATPRIERWRISRAARVYSCLTRSSSETLGARCSASPPPEAASVMRAASRGRQTSSAATPATRDAGGDVEPVVVARRHDREPDPRRPQQPEHLRGAAADEERHRDGDDQGVGGVQARHRRVRVGQRGDALVVDRGVLGERVGEASGNIRGGAVGTSTYSAEADQVGDDERVAEARERVVAPEVDPEERQPRRRRTARASTSPPSGRSAASSPRRPAAAPARRACRCCAGSR